MLIKVFDSEWFEPTGIRLKPYYGSVGTFIIHYMEEATVLSIDDKTPDEVAAEINKQIKLTKE
jgi:hypothetical protein